MRLIDVPLADGNDPQAQIYIVDHLAPGSVIRRRIEVSSTLASATHVILYSAAARIQGGSFLGAAGHTPNDLSTWTSVDPGASDVPAGGLVTATVSIAAPTDAAPGEHYAVVWVEARSAPASGGGVVQVSRVGLRLYVSVGPGGPPAADFTIESLTAQRATDGRPMILASVQNTGGRALDMSGILQLSDGPAALTAGPFQGALGTTLAIGDTESVTFVLDPQLPPGPWDATLTLRSGLVARTVKATITFPSTGASGAVSATPGRSGWLRAGMVLLIIVLLLGISTLAITKRRPSRLSARWDSPKRRSAT